MTDLDEIESLQERIARIEETVKQIQGELGIEQKGSGRWGGSDPLADPDDEPRPEPPAERD